MLVIVSDAERILYSRGSSNFMESKLRSLRNDILCVFGVYHFSAGTATKRQTALMAHQKNGSPAGILSVYGMGK